MAVREAVDTKTVAACRELIWAEMERREYVSAEELGEAMRRRQAQ